MRVHKGFHHVWYQGIVKSTVSGVFQDIKLKNFRGSWLGPKLKVNVYQYMKGRCHKRLFVWPPYGGFQLLDLIITELKRTLIGGNLLSSLNAVISTNERH